MPFIEVKVNWKLASEEASKLMDGIVGTVACEMHKPLPRIMCFLEEMQGMKNQSQAPMMLVSIRAKGELTKEEKGHVCDALLKTINEAVCISEDRIYILFLGIADGAAWQFSEGKAECGPGKQ